MGIESIELALGFGARAGELLVFPALGLRSVHLREERTQSSLPVGPISPRIVRRIRLCGWVLGDLALLGRGRAFFESGAFFRRITLLQHLAGLWFSLRWNESPRLDLIVSLDPVNEIHGESHQTLI